MIRGGWLEWSLFVVCVVGVWVALSLTRSSIESERSARLEVPTEGLVCLEPVRDFGRVDTGQPLAHTFVFVNRSDRHEPFHCAQPFRNPSSLLVVDVCRGCHTLAQRFRHLGERPADHLCRVSMPSKQRSEELRRHVHPRRRVETEGKSRKDPLP